MKVNSLVYVKFENQKVPEFKQVRGKEWIYWGEDNCYPDYLIDLYMRSSTNNAIITGKTNYIIGGGWKANKIGATVNNEAILNKLINTANADESLNELCEKVILDFEIFNAISIEVIWNKAKTDFALHHIPFNKLRCNEKEDLYFYSKDWSQVNQSEEKTGLKELKVFNESEKQNSIFVYKIKAPRSGKDPNVYPMPEYIGSTQAIETDVECSNYNLSEIKTGFSAGTILNFYNGVPEPDAKKEIEKQIKAKFSGTDRAGGIILNFADNKDRGSEVTALSGNDLDKRYIELKKDVRQEIFTGHKVSSPMLFGVKTEGQLGGRSEIVEAYELFQSTYINRRKQIIEKIFNKFLKIKGVAGKIELQRTSTIDATTFSENTIVQNMPRKAVQELIAARLGIDLSKYENTTVTTTVQTQMAKEKAVEDEFENIGSSKDLFSIIRSKTIENANMFSISKLEKDYFANELTETEKSIIDLIDKDNLIDDIMLGAALARTAKEIAVIVSGLIDAGYIGTTKSGRITTDLGLETILEEGAKTANKELLYSYELRHNAPALVPGGESRPFCKKLIALNKLYTRAEIDELSNGMELDVWAFKGGWYTNPNTDAPTPQCRHIWVQHVVKRK